MPIDWAAFVAGAVLGAGALAFVLLVLEVTRRCPCDDEHELHNMHDPRIDKLLREFEQHREKRP